MSTTLIELRVISSSSSITHSQDCEQHSSSSLIELFEKKVVIAMTNLETSLPQLQAAAFDGSILELKYLVNEHDNLVKQFSRACVMLDKARIVTKSLDCYLLTTGEMDMTEKKVTFLEELIEFHVGYTFVWENKAKYETFILDSFYVLNKTISYMKCQDTWKEHKILGHLLSLWETAKQLYPKESAFIQKELLSSL
jgi:hypothetical protein